MTNNQAKQQVTVVAKRCRHNAGGLSHGHASAHNPKKERRPPPLPAKKKKKERRKEEKEASVPMERRSFLEKITWSLPAADTIGAVVRSESDNQIQRKRRGEGEGERQLRRGEGLVQASNSCFCMKINPVKGRASKLTCFRAHGCVSLETK